MLIMLETIDWLNSVLADEYKVFNIIKEDLLEVKKRFGDARRTQLTIDTSNIEIADLIAEEDIIITISHQGYIKFGRARFSTTRNVVAKVSGVAAVKKLMTSSSI